MADVRITCIRKSHPNGGHEHITHVGNPHTRGGGWLWTVAQVVASIEAKTNTFYVFDDRIKKRADVGVVRPASGRPYLRTYADGYWNDNLLALPGCS